MNTTFRDGKIEDCLKLAELNYIASGGVVEFLFNELVPGKSPIQIVAGNFAGDHEYHTFRDSIVAEYEQKVVGMSLSYSSRFHRISNGMRQFFPEKRLNHIKNIFTSRVEDSLYLDTLCVDQNFRGKGVGWKLLSLTREKALAQGIRTLSLIVLADNTGAQKLYQRFGFEIVSHIEMEPHELIPHEGGAFLMKCPV